MFGEAGGTVALRVVTRRPRLWLTILGLLRRFSPNEGLSDAYLRLDAKGVRVKRLLSAARRIPWEQELRDLLGIRDPDRDTVGDRVLTVPPPGDKVAQESSSKRGAVMSALLI